MFYASRLGETVRRQSTDGSDLGNESGDAYRHDRQNSNAAEHSLPEPSMTVQDAGQERQQGEVSTRGGHLFSAVASWHDSLLAVP